MSTAVNEEPVARVRHFPITVAIWEKQSAEGRPYFTFSVQRSYRAPDGNWQNANSFFAAHAQHLKMAIDDAWRWIEKRNRELIQEGRQTDATGEVSDAVVEGDIPF
jgi:hypothetical protein